MMKNYPAIIPSAIKLPNIFLIHRYFPMLFDYLGWDKDLLMTDKNGWANIGSFVDPLAGLLHRPY